MLKSCFCCLSLKTGALITGWLRLVLGIVHILVICILYSSINLEDTDLTDNIRKINFLRFDIVLTSLNIYGFISLLFGVYKGRAGFLVPYLWLGSLQLAEYIFILLVWLWHCFSSQLHPMYLILGFLPLVILQYLFCVVGSFYMQLRSGIRKLKNGNPVV